LNIENIKGHTYCNRILFLNTVFELDVFRKEFGGSVHVEPQHVAYDICLAPISLLAHNPFNERQQFWLKEKVKQLFET